MIWHLALYEDRLVVHNGQHLPFTGPVEAHVGTAGNIAVTRGRNLAAKGARTLLLGPVSLLTIGNAKQTTIDTRALFLLVEGPGWAYTQKFDPRVDQALRKFGGLINVTARSFWETHQPLQVPTTTVELAGQLRELGRLHQDGVGYGGVAGLSEKQ